MDIEQTCSVVFDGTGELHSEVSVPSALAERLTNACERVTRLSYAQACVIAAQAHKSINGGAMTTDEEFFSRRVLVAIRSRYPKLA